MQLEAGYLERLYAGVLGKIIGVYLGRPFEGWLCDRIIKELGPITGYVHKKLKQPLIVTDDDISGTFTFIRALEDYGFDPQITTAQIGRTWMNYIIENRTILWWGGMGVSTEHTAFLRMKHGIEPPRSGAIATNGPLVAQQIGAQIFIDGWGMVAPGDPDSAASLATRAASVSHDGEAIHGAVVVATIEAMAFGESNIVTLVERSLNFVPAYSTIGTMNRFLLELRGRESDWQTARARFAEIYNYDNYPGGCHVVPNHGLIILGLLWGDGDFGRSLMITNTCGWDTDCNSGNVGCIMGIRNGLDGIGSNWRDAVADRMYIPTADGGRCVTDAARETIRLANSARGLRGVPPIAPKNGARFHFSLPGSVHGFACDAREVRLDNPGGALRIALPPLGEPLQITTRTHPPADLLTTGYGAIASPTLYAGQTLRASVKADAAARVRLIVKIDADGAAQTLGGEWISISGRETRDLAWTVRTPAGAVVVETGLEAACPGGATLLLDHLTWDGEPDCIFIKPESGGNAWKHAFVSSLSSIWHDAFGMSFICIQNEGRGTMTTGTSKWRNYRVHATVMPHMCRAMGVVARWQGLNRYYALLLEPGRARLIKRRDDEQVLAEQPIEWSWRQTHGLAIRGQNDLIEAYIDDQKIFEVYDTDTPLTHGGAGVICDEGQLQLAELKLTPS